MFTLSAQSTTDTKTRNGTWNVEYKRNEYPVKDWPQQLFYVISSICSMNAMTCEGHFFNSTFQNIFLVSLALKTVFLTHLSVSIHEWITSKF